ncbi:DUF397 domain-containing protein [Streptomyces scabiei]|uniref:DUF397 domain-containing protein n=1 Tax=Streptomyces scabiei TaxID=1930 RepID=UPI00299F9216|nr:DUF397 domain-containing protein [Streptomyces scabiei]MDX3521141.1 DUF397 domain-containing protein [Streptomyces scabiei]
MTFPGAWQKSTFSDGGEGDTCVELAAVFDTWQKSTFSGGAEGNACVELAASPTTLHLRESNTPATHLRTTPTPLAGLLHHIKAGGFRTTS